MRKISLKCRAIPVAVAILAAQPVAVAGETAFRDDVTFQTGQVILTESGGPISALMALIPGEFHPFSHAGIIVVEAGEAVVYEARGAYKMGPGTPASSWFEDRSGILRLSIDEYLQREKYAMVYAPPAGIDTQAVAGFARRHYEAGTPFDPYFDDRTGEALYCAEFVHTALSAGGWRGIVSIPERSNPSLRKVLDWWGIRGDGVMPVGLLVAESRYVGELGGSKYRVDALVFNAFKAEIHRRFTPDQKLGNIFESNGDLLFREPVLRLLRESKRLQRERDTTLTFETARDRVETLAAEMFGPFPSTHAEIHDQSLHQVRLPVGAGFLEY